MNSPSYRRATQQQRSDELIQATLDTISKGGLQNATIRNIANSAGVTPGLIRHYFPGKNALILAAYQTLMHDLTHSVVSQVPSKADRSYNATQRLRFFIEQNFHSSVLDETKLSLWAAFISIVPTDAEMKVVHHESYIEFREKLEDLLVDFFEEITREVSKTEIQAAAIALNGLIDGLWLEGCLGHQLLNNQELAALAVKSAAAILQAPLS